MNYEQIFRERGAAYDRAMQQWPHARDEEFRLPVRWAELQAGDRVVDVPAGGGYLRRYLPAHCTWLGHEPARGFLDGTGAPGVSLLPLPWPDRSADAAISIAGLHHLEDKCPFYAELHRVLQSGGRMVIADVHTDSPVAGFLDDFVGRHNSTGHHGLYLDATTGIDIERAGFRITRAERRRYCWWFASRDEMGAFCRLLFDIRTIDNAGVAAAIDTHLGTRSENGKTGMSWELYVIAATAEP